MPRRRDPPAVCAIVKWAFDLGAPGVISNFRPRPACCGAGEAALHRDARERAPPGLNRGRRGGQIGSFLGFRGNGSLAVLAVLAYRMISYWRPTVPGVIA